MPTGLLAGLLADVVQDTCFGNRWHCLAAATDELTDDDLGYRPVPSVRGPREILRHVAQCARGYGDGLACRTPDECEQEWDRLRGRRAAHAEDLIRVTEVALRRLQARARRVTDDQLLERSGVWNDAYKGFVPMDGAILHTAWHLGQVAMLTGWRRSGDGGGAARPGGPAGTEPKPRRLRTWTDFDVRSRKDVCLRLLRAAYEESPWHSIRRTLEGASPAELGWSPFPSRRGPSIAMHTAHCKVIYADQAFGGRTLDWGDCDRLLGVDWAQPTSDRMLGALDRAHAVLADHVAQATEEDLDRVNPMHHRTPMAGWQVVASMAQHDAWHAGQIAIMRHVFSALAHGGSRGL